MKDYMRNLFLAGLMCIPVVALAQEDPEWAAVHQSLTEQRSEITKCYDAITTRDPTVKGSLHITFIITPRGFVRRPRIDKNTTNSRWLGECVVSKLRNIEVHPAPADELVMSPYIYNFVGERK
jgi:hypothetical protein